MNYAELREAYGSQAFKIYAHINFEEKFLDPLKPPKDIDFKKGLPELKPVQGLEISGGDVQNSKYFASASAGQYLHPLTMVEFEWNRAALAGGVGTILSERFATACWSRVGEDDSEIVWAKEPENVKTWSKPYDERTGRLADKRKRANIIDEMLAQVGPFGVLSYVQTMLNSLDDERNGYIDTYDDRFITKILTYSGTWIDTEVSAQLGLPAGTTLRHAILGSLDYDKRIVGQ